MIFGSLFAGIGGFDLGLERAGHECVFQVERDEKCRAVLERRFPKANRFDDVRTFNQTSVAVRPDLLCGGFPCQDISVAGRRAGLAGERSGLFYEFMRIAAEFAPQWILIENVPGLLSSNGRRDMGAVVGSLGQLGYGWAYRVLDAQWFGVPHRRRRVFIVGCLGDGRRAAEILFERNSLPWDSPPRRQARTRVAAGLTRGSATGSNDPGRRREDDVNLVARSITTREGQRMGCDQDTFIVTDYSSGGYRQSEVSGAITTTDDRSRNAPIVAHTLRAEGHDASEDGTGRGVPLVAAFKRCQGSKARTDGYQIEQAPTLTSSDSGTQQSPGVQIGASVRRLTPVECERLQGFPDDWTEGHSDSARYRMLGNAVAVPVAQWIGERLLKC